MSEKKPFGSLVAAAQAADQLLTAVAPGYAEARIKARNRIGKLQNRFDMASRGRRASKYVVHDNGANSAMRGALPVLRARSRDAVRNNAYAARAINVLTVNSVGPGIRPTLVPEAGKLKPEVQERMARYLESTAVDVDGRHNLYGLQALAARAMFESGEALILPVVTKNPNAPLQLRVLEGDYIDTAKNETKPGGGRVVQGVEFDSVGRRVGYWLFDAHPSDGFSLSTTSRFIAEADVLHLYEVLRPGQVRGIPRGTSSYMRLQNLDEFQDARVAQAKASACAVGVIVDPNGDSDEGPDAEFPEKMEPGAFLRGTPGTDVRFNNPSPIVGHKEFVATEQRTVAIGYNVPYELLTGDLAEVNYSSARMGFMEFIRSLDALRWNTLIPIMCQRIGDWLLDAMRLHGHIHGNYHMEWAPPRYELLDPSREIPPLVDSVRAGLRSRASVVREMGYEPSVVLNEITEERAEDELRGLVFTTDASKVSNAGVTQSRTGSTEDDFPKTVSKTD